MNKDEKEELIELIDAEIDKYIERYKDIDDVISLEYSNGFANGLTCARIVINDCLRKYKSREII